MKSGNLQVLATGMAMFAMFFGAGNAIFPLTIGYYAQDKTFFGIAGLLLTAVIVPFTGLVAMFLYGGDYKSFFSRIGKVPGFIAAAVIMALIGPFGGMPRCVAASFSTLKVIIPELSSVLFCLAACLLLFACTVKKNRIVDLVGYLLTPALLGSLGWIIVQGIWTATSMPVSGHDSWEIFTYGLYEGYNTMDLLAALFFAPVVLASLQNTEKGAQFGQLLKASLIGATLLAMTYIGFCLLTAYHGEGITVAGGEELIGAVALAIVGQKAGLLAALIVVLACLTTAIALATVFAEFLQEVICRNKISYLTSLAITLSITFVLATLEFSGIATFLAPVLQVGYPALIVLTGWNIWMKVRARQSPLQKSDC